VQKLLLGLYITGDVATLLYLTFFDGYIYTWWNWLIVVPINIFLGTIWPIYWLVLRPLLG
jgi:hypothetical protein